jgi:trans-4-hydroxy-L-proline dehydratase
MLWNAFYENREHLNNQYSSPQWIGNSGLKPEKLEEGANFLIKKMEGQPKPLIKAKVFDYVLRNGRIDVGLTDWFQDRIEHRDILRNLRQIWWRYVDDTYMAEMHTHERNAWSIGAFYSGADFSHTSPDWNSLLELGIPGLLKRIRDTRNSRLDAEELTENETVFYEASEIVYDAVIAFLLRLAMWTEKMAETSPTNRERLLICAQSLKNLAVRAPETMHEALQLGIIYYELQEMEGEYVRSHGGFERLYYRFYDNDIKSNRYTLEQERELIRFFYTKLNANRFYSGRSFYLGGILPNGKDAVNPLTYDALDIYNELGLPYIKFQIRVHSSSPDDFLIKALDYIRSGNNSIVFIHDETVIAALMRTGVSLTEAREYTPIGCYETAVMGLEVPCTLNSFINTTKAVELTLHGGTDPLTGTRLGTSNQCVDYASFETFYDAVKKQLESMVKTSMDVVLGYEKYYMEINPSPLFSGTLADCVKKGRDAYAGGARYNNSSIVFGGLGSTVDSLVAIRKFVFENQEISLGQFVDILQKNWEGNELLRLKIYNDLDKWGNNRVEPDIIACDIMNFASKLVIYKPNNRGGVFKTGLFTIDHHVVCGSKMGATPDGRKAMAPLSKNLSSVIAMDRQGVTALISSAAKIDFTQFPDGTVLDVMLHPSTVQGKDGLFAMLYLVKTFFKEGGYSMQYNVLDVNTLKRAQENPKEYANLQVRVCGWNAYFIDLGKSLQDEFIRQAKKSEV